MVAALEAGAVAVGSATPVCTGLVSGDVMGGAAGAVALSAAVEVCALATPSTLQQATKALALAKKARNCIERSLSRHGGACSALSNRHASCPMSDFHRQNPRCAQSSRTIAATTRSPYNALASRR